MIFSLAGSTMSEHQNTAPTTTEPERPATTVRHVSAPAYHSPIHQHHRQASSRRQVKETLDAKSEYTNSQDDGTPEHRINQYVIKQEIGRGSFGSVHLAVDHFGREFAVKEFSKMRLRKRAQSYMLRRHNNTRRPSTFHVNTPPTVSRAMSNLPTLFGSSPSGSWGAGGNSLDLIRKEIAIMKKLNHPNLVSLIEVLDDPTEDLLYMVLEMCKKGPVLHVGLDSVADPYDNERCRFWFRDMVLGLEYLHAQGIVHRDIKPDNCLVTHDDVLKIVDFGVSEMFDKDSDMQTAKYAGSPAFMPPELCVAKRGDVSGPACDIWSMGVTLYCLAFGHIPFEKNSMVDLFEAIKNDEAQIAESCHPLLRDLLGKLLDKDPNKRIKMDEIREHAWVTLDGTDPLLPKEENIMSLVEPTEEEVRKAITTPMFQIVAVMKAANKFKRLLNKKRPVISQNIFGEANQMTEPPDSILSGQRPHQNHHKIQRIKSDTLANREAVEGNLVSEGISRKIEVDVNLHTVHEPALDDVQDAKKIENNTSLNGFQQPATALPETIPLPISTNSTPKPIQSAISMPPLQLRTDESLSGRGQAHDPLEDTIYINVGTSSDAPTPEPGSPFAVCESPSMVDDNVYEKAYEKEINRIIQARQKEGTIRPTLYLTKRVESVPRLRDHEYITDWGRQKMVETMDSGGKVIDEITSGGKKLAGLVVKNLTGLGHINNSKSDDKPND